MVEFYIILAFGKESAYAEMHIIQIIKIGKDIAAQESRIDPRITFVDKRIGEAIAHRSQLEESVKILQIVTT